MNFNIQQIGTNAAIGIADGVLARKDAQSPTRWNQPLKHWSLWAEVGAVALGVIGGSMSRSASAQMMAESAVLTGGALIARRGGVYLAERQESPRPTYPATMPALPPGIASAQVMRPAATEFVNPAGRVPLRQSQNQFV